MTQPATTKSSIQNVQLSVSSSFERILNHCSARPRICVSKDDPRSTEQITLDAGRPVNPESIVFAEHDPGGTADEITLDAVLHGLLVDGQCPVDGVDGPIDVLVAVRVAHDERGGQNASLDQLLQEQRAERLRWLSVRIASEVPRGCIPCRSH